MSFRGPKHKILCINLTIMSRSDQYRCPLISQEMHNNYNSNKTRITPVDYSLKFIYFFFFCAPKDLGVLISFRDYTGVLFPSLCDLINIYMHDARAKIKRQIETFKCH